MLSQRDALKLRATQTKIMARHLRLPKLEIDEPDDVYMKRVFHNIKEIKRKHHLADLDAIALRRAHKFAGHVARRAYIQHDSLLGQALLWNCHQRAVSCQNGRKHQGFRRFSPWTMWEYQFVRFYFHERNVHWMDFAQDRGRWRSSENDYVSWRLGETAARAQL